MYMNERETIGDIGEVIIQEFFNSTRSNYKYDQEKDGMIVEMTYGAKTFRLNKKTQSFWLSNNKIGMQWSYIDKLKLLFFIRVPETENDLGELYLAIDHRNSYDMVTTNQGVPCRSYPLTSCLKLCNVSPERSKILYENSIKIRRVK